MVPAALGDEFGDNLTCWRSVSAETKAKTLDNPPRVAPVRSPGALGPMCGVSGRRCVGPPQTRTYCVLTKKIRRVAASLDEFKVDLSAITS